MKSPGRHRRRQHEAKRAPAWNIVFVVALLLAASAAIGAQSLYYQAYDRGVRAYEAGNWAVARQMFERALQLDARQARRRNMGGTFFGEYIPEYYLGLISVQEKRFDDAIKYFDRIVSAGLVGPNDKEYATLTAQRAVADTEVKRTTIARATPESRGTPPPPETTRPITTTTSAPVTGPVTEPIRPTLPGRSDQPVGPGPPGANSFPTAGGARGGASEVDRLSSEVTRNLNGGEFERAWETVQRMGALPGGSEAARSLAAQVRAGIATAGDRRLQSNDLPGAGRYSDLLTRVAPASSEAQRLRRLLDDRLGTVRLERDTLKNLLLGDYQKVVSLTASSVDSRRASARLMFYAACGRAGLSLIATTTTRENLASDARRLYGAANRLGGSFTREEPYISPEILALLKKP